MQRYDKEYADMIESDDGDWVKYEDAQAALAAKDAEIERLKSAITQLVTTGDSGRPPHRPDLDGPHVRILDSDLNREDSFFRPLIGKEFDCLCGIRDDGSTAIWSEDTGYVKAWAERFEVVPTRLESLETKCAAMRDLLDECKAALEVPNGVSNQMADDLVAKIDAILGSEEA